MEEAARAARGTVADLAGVPAGRLDQALRGIADTLGRRPGPVLDRFSTASTVLGRAPPRGTKPRITYTEWR